MHDPDDAPRMAAEDRERAARGSRLRMLTAAATALADDEP
jgi:hypothetical protein